MTPKLSTRSVPRTCIPAYAHILHTDPVPTPSEIVGRVSLPYMYTSIPLHTPVLPLTHLYTHLYFLSHICTHIPLHMDTAKPRLSHACTPTYIHLHTHTSLTHTASPAFGGADIGCASKISMGRSLFWRHCFQKSQAASETLRPRTLGIFFWRQNSFFVFWRHCFQKAQAVPEFLRPVPSVRKHTHTQTDTRTHVCTCIQERLRMCGIEFCGERMCVCVCVVYIYTHMCVCVCMYIPVCVCLCLCVVYYTYLYDRLTGVSRSSIAVHRRCIAVIFYICTF